MLHELRHRGAAKVHVLERTASCGLPASCPRSGVRSEPLALNSHEELVPLSRLKSPTTSREPATPRWFPGATCYGPQRPMAHPRRFFASCSRFQTTPSAACGICGRIYRRSPLRTDVATPLPPPPSSTGTMFGAYLPGTSEVELREVPIPIPGPGRCF